MIHVIAGLGFLIAVAFGILGLAVYLWNLKVPHVFRGIFWALPIVPFVMLICFAVFVAAYPTRA